MSKRFAQAFWSAHSRTWDDSLADAAVAAHIEELADWLASAVTPDGTVIDLGCGTGNHAVALARRGVVVVGIDSARGMLTQAGRKGVVLVRADLAALPVRPVDGALSVYSVQFFTLAPFFAEARRALKTGGAFLVVVPRHAGSQPRPGLSLRFRAFQQIKNVVAFAGRSAGRVHFYASDDVRGALETAGFTVIEQRDNDRNFAVLARAA